MSSMGKNLPTNVRCIQRLILVPTTLELDLLRRIGLNSLANDESTVTEICGFGPIVSAARTAQLISQFEPKQVLLLGIAGTYCDDLPIGQAFRFGQIGCYGVGAGEGNAFQTANELGWQQWENDQIKLHSLALRSSNLHAESLDQFLLTCTAASGNDDDVQRRLIKFPQARAEDMEGFGVAVACQLNDVPLSIVRGISNRAGDRNKSHWRIEDALAAAVELSSSAIDS